MAESAFARKQLEKAGWKEGDGLGKNRDGISKPIKASLKMDKTGVGHNSGSEFTDHWWLRVFNDAASSITKSPQNTETTEKTALPQKIYKGFVRGTVLSNGKEEKDSDCCSSDDEPELSTSSSGLPTLDDLYKFCGGATGSRAGALGIKMKGKLHRAAEQERLFNEGKSPAKTETENGNSDEPGESKEKRKKKKKKSSKQVENIIEADDTTTENESLMPKISQGSKENDETEESMRKKHKKNKKRKKEEDRITDQVLCESEEKTTAVKKRKKTKEVEPNHASGEENVESVCEEMNGHIKQKKKKKKRKD